MLHVSIVTPAAAEFNRRREEARQRMAQSAIDRKAAEERARAEKLEQDRQAAHKAALHAAIERAAAEHTVKQYREVPIVAVETPTEKFSRIMREVARVARIKEETLLGDKRQTSIVMARHFAQFRCVVEIEGKSLPWVGRKFGKDHTTILNALYRTAERIEKGVIPTSWLKTCPAAVRSRDISELVAKSAARRERAAAAHHRSKAAA